jgi:NADH:ubiquinone oxidoreductase subunit K
MNASTGDMLLLVLGLSLQGIGILCLLTRRRALKVVFGLNLMLQGALLLIVAAGLRNGQLAMAQGMVIASLLVETVVMAITLALLLNIHRHYPEGLIDDVDRLRG